MVRATLVAGPSAIAPASRPCRPIAACGSGYIVEPSGCWCGDPGLGGPTSLGNSGAAKWPAAPARPGRRQLECRLLVRSCQVHLSL